MPETLMVAVPVTVVVYVSKFDNTYHYRCRGSGPRTRRIRQIADSFEAHEISVEYDVDEWYNTIHFMVPSETYQEFCWTLTGEGYKNEVQTIIPNSERWMDQPLPEDDEIAEAHPVRSGRHDLYMDAMRLVGARRSKGSLVELVTWLLLKVDVAESQIESMD